VSGAVAAPPEIARPAAGRLIATALACTVLLFASLRLHLLGQPLYAVLLLVLAAGVAIVFGHSRFLAGQFVFPAVAAVLLFIAFPVAYTIWLGFTNYGSFNLLSKQRATEVLLATRDIDETSTRAFSLVPDGDGYRVHFSDTGAEPALLSEAHPLDGSAAVLDSTAVSEPPAEPLARREAIRLRAGLQAIAIATPDGGELRYASLRAFAVTTPVYTRDADDRLVSADGQTLLTADDDSGFYLDQDGQRVAPGWRVPVGLANFERIFTSAGIREPLFGIFVWTLMFAALSMGLTFALGVTLAALLQWPHLRFKRTYRILLILPYAVPSFISILVFRGLFNQNFGEINLIIEALSGGRPDWFTDPALARSMVLIVNVWLGYPYMMLLAMGFLQSVPSEHTEAATLDGAGPFTRFVRIVLPQILPPFVPLLIATFAFNFNNIVLILLLTGGGPDTPGTRIPAGSTDILGSFTYRLAFQDSGQQFGLAGAITLLIFLAVGALAWLNLVALRRRMRHTA